MEESKVQNSSPKVKPQLTQSRLKELLHYDPETGVFKWNVSRGRSIPGSIAGYKRENGYIRIIIDYKKYYASRLAFFYMEGYFPEYDIDHLNRIRWDNRWGNLRHVNRRCNSRNRSISSLNTSGVTGVQWYSLDKRWVSKITIKGKTLYLGMSKNFKEAVRARWDAEVKYGFPNCNTTSSAYVFLQED